MNKQEQIRQYLEQTFEALAKINPSLANADRRQRANDMFLNAEADFEIVKQKIDKTREELLESYQEQLKMREFYKKMREQGYYQNFEKDNRDSRTFAQVREAYNRYLDDFQKIQELMSKTMDTYCAEFLEKKE